MHVYVVEMDGGVRFARTLDMARLYARAEAPVFRAAVEVREVSIATDKAAIVTLLDNPDEFREAVRLLSAIRAWRGTRRGGLKKLDLA